MSPGSSPLAHHLPWYFGVAMAVIWAAAMAGAGLLAYRRWQGRVTRRRRRLDAGSVRDERSLGPGNDLELW
jgi:hypothetical protein